MKITRIVCQVLRIEKVQQKTSACQDSVLVRVRTDNGLEGIGEADSSPEVVKAVVDAPYSHNVACGLRELLVGENPLETGRLWQKMYRGTQYFGRTSVTISAMAAVDMALWDLKGKCFGQPVHRLLGGKFHDRVLAYASILFGRDGAETREIARRWREVGYRAVKLGWEPMGPSEALDLELVRGGREGVGDDATLLIDAGCVWDTRTALRRAQRFAEYNIGWLEEPLQQANVDGYVWLRDRSPVPIAAGEGECGSEAFRPLVDRHALDVYQVDLARNGFTEAAYIRRRVEEIGGRLCNHCYTSAVTVAASLHWLSTCREAFLFEDCVEDSPLRHELTVEKLQAVDGWIEVPDRPGLGVTINEDFVRSRLIAEWGGYNRRLGRSPSRRRSDWDRTLIAAGAPPQPTLRASVRCAPRFTETAGGGILWGSRSRSRFASSCSLWSRSDAMKGNEKVIQKLDQLLADELTAVNQYVVHAEMCANWGYDRLHEKVEKRAIQEMKHAEKLIARIIFLEGAPTVSRLNPIHIGPDVPKQLESDLAAEMGAIRSYNEGIHLADELGDAVSRTLLEGILKEEDEHVDWLEEQLDQIAQMGLPMYLSTQTEE